MSVRVVTTRHAAPLSVPEAAKEKLPARKYRTAGEFVTLSLHHRGCINLIYITPRETCV